MDLDDVFGTNKKTVPEFKFPTLGNEVTIKLTEDGKVLPVHDFVGGKRGEQLFWQNNKAVKFSDLEKALPHNPVVQVLLIGKDKDGTEHSIWASGEKLKALRKAVKETGISTLAGVVVRMKFSEEKDTGAPFKKKLYTVWLKPAKSNG